jgi:hypothetical protein
MSFTYPNFDQGLGRTKKGVDFARETILLGALGIEGIAFDPGNIGAAVANTTVQGVFVLPCRAKISKVMVFFSAIASVAGTHSFNIVFGTTGAYTQGNVPGNDNSSVPAVAYDAQGRATGAATPAYPAGGAGFCTNPAVAGQSMFAADVLFNVANFPNLTTATGTGTSLAQFLAPSSPDAVWPSGAVLTLRMTTPASTGSITGPVIGLALEPQPLSASYPSSQQPGAYIVVPGTDY